MAIEVIMAALEMSQDSGLLVKWLKSEGEPVNVGEPLMEIETDKAVMEIEASASGILSLDAQPGDEVPVGQVIAWLLEEGEEPPARSLEKKKQTEQARSSFSNLPEKKELETTVSVPKKSGKVRASPRARRMARELGIDLGTVVGSGPGCAILPEDLSETGSKKDEGASEDYRVVALKGTRRTVAQRTQKSYQIAPHISLSMVIDANQLLGKSRKNQKDSNQQETSPAGFTSLLLKCVATCLQKHPRLNAHLIYEEIREFTQVHLGVAVAIEEGLVVPVLRNTEQKEAWEIHAELEDLVTRARQRRLKVEEMQGSTFTVSNLGMYGISHFTSILNLPEVGILSVGAVRKTPVVIDETVVVRPLMNVTLNADHRAVDGMVAARFLQTLQELSESPSDFS